MGKSSRSIDGTEKSGVFREGMLSRCSHCRLSYDQNDCPLTLNCEVSLGRLSTTDQDITVNDKLGTDVNTEF